MQNGPVLAGVQVPPLPLPLVVVLLARLATLRAGPTPHIVMIQMDVDLTLG